MNKRPVQKNIITDVTIIILFIYIFSVFSPTQYRDHLPISTSSLMGNPIYYFFLLDKDRMQLLTAKPTIDQLE